MPTTDGSGAIEQDDAVGQFSPEAAQAAYVAWYGRERRQNWRTPDTIFGPLHDEYGFTLDGASELGIHMEDIQFLLGHADPRVTQRYAQTDIDDVRERIAMARRSQRV